MRGPGNEVVGYVPDDHDHYDVTAHEARRCTKFSKMAPSSVASRKVQLFEVDLSNHSSSKWYCIWISRSNYRYSLRGKWILIITEKSCIKCIKYELQSSLSGGNMWSKTPTYVNEVAGYSIIAPPVILPLASFQSFDHCGLWRSLPREVAVSRCCILLCSNVP